VCDIEEREDGVAVTVAYGTSQQVNRLHAGEFSITKLSNPAAYGAAGLSFDTKFNVGQTVQLPWAEEFFAVPPRAPMGQNPKLGSLHASMYRAAQAAHRAVQGKD
jgi:hypothetical protein